MKYFTLVLLLAIVVVASAFPYESFGKRRGGRGGSRGGGGSGGKGGKGSGGQGPGGRGPESSGSEAEGAGGQKQQPEGQQSGQDEEEEFGINVSQECRALLVAMKKQRDEQKQAEEAAGEEETRALKLLRELEKELSVRQDGEEASPADLEALEIDCYDSFFSRIEDLEETCAADSEADGCEGFAKLEAAYKPIEELVAKLSEDGSEKAPAPAALCYDILSSMHDQIQKEEEEEEEEEEPPEEARKREEVVSGYEKMWDQFKNVHKVIGACERVFVGPRREGKGKDEGKDQEQRPEAQGQGQGQDKGQGQGPDQEPAGEGPVRRGIYSARRG